VLDDLLALCFAPLPTLLAPHALVSDLSAVDRRGYLTKVGLRKTLGT
jgi:hypothetical protein